MKKLILTSVFLVIGFFIAKAQQTERDTYLKPILVEMQKPWPNNRTINIVFHGHSVPTGYFATPIVNTLDAYPHLTLKSLKSSFPNAVVNVITTSIGGEQSEQGARRFNKDVLCHRPDVLFIDYALNDRSIGLDRARKAWTSMIVKAKKKNIKIILCTPTPDLNEDILNENAPLASHSEQIRQLALKYGTGLVDSYEAFRLLKMHGEDLKKYMSQSNHPNEQGHRIVADLISKWFENEKK